MLEPRLRRTLEIVYGVGGVSAVRVWQWPGRVAVGVRAAPHASAIDILRRVETAVAGLREEGESWDFGLLDD